MAETPSPFRIEAHHVLQFARNVELLLQQKRPIFAGKVSTPDSNYQGEAVQVVKQFGEAEFEPFESGRNPGQWQGDTVWSDIEHHQRWVAPTDFSLSLPAAKGNDLRSIGDPRSSYAQAMRAAYARKHDDLIIAAATNPAQTGRFDSPVMVNFPTTQIVGHDYNPDGEGLGLTLAKLIKVREMLLAAQNDPDEPLYLALSQRQLSNLLNMPQVQSVDYNSVRALVKGDINTFMGFEFVPTERLLFTAAAGNVPQIRHCFAWKKSGLHYGQWNGLQTEIDKRSDKNYTWQIWMSFTAGATRTQEEKVVQINCAELTE